MMSSPATMAIVFLRHMNVIATMTVETTVMKTTVKVSLFQSNCYAKYMISPKGRIQSFQIMGAQKIMVSQRTSRVCYGRGLGLAQGPWKHYRVLGALACYLSLMF